MNSLCGLRLIQQKNMMNTYDYSRRVWERVTHREGACMNKWRWKKLERKWKNAKLDFNDTNSIKMTIPKTVGYSWYQPDTSNIPTSRSFRFMSSFHLNAHGILVKLSLKEKVLWFKFGKINLFSSHLPSFLSFLISKFSLWMMLTHKISLFDFPMFPIIRYKLLPDNPE